MLELLSRWKGESVTVVTADSDLAFEARKLGASVIAPESWEPLKGKVLKPARGRPGAKSAKEDKPQASAKDVDYWLGIFGDRSSEDE